MYMRTVGVIPPEIVNKMHLEYQNKIMEGLSKNLARVQAKENTVKDFPYFLQGKELKKG